VHSLCDSKVFLQSRSYVLTLTQPTRDSAKTLVSLGLQEEILKHQQANGHNSPGDMELTSPATSIGTPTRQHTESLRDQLRAVRLWSPDYVAYALPLIPNALVGPATAFSVTSEVHSSGRTEDVLTALDGDLLHMTLRRFSEYWGIGSFCLGKCAQKLDMRERSN
jgi:hypothetical protein